MGNFKLKVGDRVVVTNGSNHYRDWAFKPVEIIVKVIDISNHDESFHGIFDDTDDSKLVNIKVEKARTRTFFFYINEIKNIRSYFIFR